MRPIRHVLLTPSLLAPALVLVACGGSSTTHTAATSTNAAATATTASAPAAKPHPGLRLRIVSPRSGAHTSQTVTVRVVLSGAPGAKSASFRYVLDRVHLRRGKARLVLRNLASGRHHLLVILASGGSARASTAFTVRAPAPLPAPAATTPAPGPAPAPAPAPTTTTTPAPAPAPPTTTTTPPSPATGGIPQNNGGDQDADNNGGPTDGDGAI